MEYKTPELTALTPAINAIQTPLDLKGRTVFENGDSYEVVPSYEDWE